MLHWASVIKSKCTYERAIGSWCTLINCKQTTTSSAFYTLPTMFVPHFIRCWVHGRTKPLDAHEKTKKILLLWLKDVGFDLTQQLKPYPTELYEELRDWVLAQRLEPKQVESILKLLPTCTSAADKWYPRASRPLKRYIALFTTFLLYVDDRAEKDLPGILPDLQSVVSNSKMGLQSVSCQDAGIALWLDLVVTETDKFFGPYSTGVITKGFVDFMLGNMVEETLAQSLTLPTNFASKSSQFIRDKTGAGEVYAHFLFSEALVDEDTHLKTYIQCIRVIVDIIDHVNIYCLSSRSLWLEQIRTHIL